MTPQRGRLVLTIISVTYLVLAVAYSFVVPLFEASDELWHYPMVKYLADHNLQLPPQDPANPGPWRQEGSQPPLYYLLTATLTGGIDTSDMNFVRRQNPHADIGIVRPDGNINMMVHRAEAEQFPWNRTVLAVHVARLFSVMLGLGTVLVTYALGREVFPDQTGIALGAAGLTAFLPMFLFISGSVNNDNLSNLLGNLLTLQIVRLLKLRAIPGIRTYLGLGLVTGAGLLAKLNVGFLIPLVALVLLIKSLRSRSWIPFLLGGLIAGALTIGIAGWWYLRNLQLYGDPTGLNMFLEMVGRRAIPANFAQLWSERNSVIQAFWGFFGGMNLPLPEMIYVILNLLGGLGMLGAAGSIVMILVKRHWTVEQWLPAILTIFWPLVTLVSFLRWTAETPASQGRLLFAALSSISLWLAVGLNWWTKPVKVPLLLIGTNVLLALTAILALFTTIKPAYALPPELRITQDDMIQRFSAPDTGSIDIIGSESDIRILTPLVRPEEYVRIQLLMRTQERFVRDWSLFVHLETVDGVIIAQRDMYPGRGLMATSDLEPGRAWKNDIAVWIPAGAYAPQELHIKLGWYDLITGERMHLPDNSYTLDLGAVALEPRPSDSSRPNPMRVNFGDEMALVGYSLSDLSAVTGDTLELILYWQGLKHMSIDYKVFAQILDPTTQTRYAASDAMPMNWQAPTSTWEPNTIIEDRHELMIAAETPPGQYELLVGLYEQRQDGSLQRLRIVTPDGGMANDSMQLSPVRVIPAEKE